MHYKGDPEGNTQDAFDTGQPYGVWHTAITLAPQLPKFQMDQCLG